MVACKSIVGSIVYWRRTETTRLPYGGSTVALRFCDIFASRKIARCPRDFYDHCADTSRFSHVCLTEPVRYVQSYGNRTCTVLGVTFNNTLSFSPHIQNVTAKAATTLCALKTLKVRGLQGKALWEVTRATVVAQITYASTSWSGFIKCDELTRLKAIVSQASRYGYLPANFPSLEQLLESCSDESLFTATRQSAACTTPTSSSFQNHWL